MRKYIELKEVRITQWDKETIKIFGRNPKFITTISNNPDKKRYHRTFYKKLKEFLEEQK